MKTNPIHFIRWFFILGMILFSIFPSFYIILVSLKSINSFQVSLDQDLFSNLSSHNFTRLFSETDFLVWLKNSVLVSLAVTVCGVALASTCAYALSRYSFSGKKFLLFSLLATQMFPATMMMLPFFIILTKLSLIDSFLGLSLIYSSTALPFGIWQLKAYYDT
ncbi:MAG: sugar ABC transporter permease, partial [Bdellovibrionaceae bacterium]|nr:sugar ABC transporter permease [Pseudobdellovibrionaceae bacterium]